MQNFLNMDIQTDKSMKKRSRVLWVVPSYEKKIQNLNENFRLLHDR